MFVLLDHEKQFWRMFLLFGLVFAPQLTRSQNLNVGLPSVHSYSDYDEIKTPSGFRCRQALNSGPKLDMGFVGSTSDREGRDGSIRPEPLEKYGAYMRVIMPLGGRVNRVDCTRVYEMEMDRLQMEVNLLKQQMELQSFETGQYVR